MDRQGNENRRNSGREMKCNMTVISTTTDPEALRLTVVAEFSATPERVWEVWENPRQLERWWGPPTYPATFTRHDFEVGGESRYFMTGPEGDTPHGWWRMYLIDEPRQLERWWGPPTYPATFTRHDFKVGGESRYFMTGPEGDTPHGWWRMRSEERPVGR